MTSIILTFMAKEKLARRSRRKILPKAINPARSHSVRLVTERRLASNLKIVFDQLAKMRP